MMCIFAIIYGLLYNIPFVYSPVNLLTHVPHYLICVLVFGALSGDINDYVQNRGKLVEVSQVFEVENFFLQTFLTTGDKLLLSIPCRNLSREKPFVNKTLQRQLSWIACFILGCGSKIDCMRTMTQFKQDTDITIPRPCMQQLDYGHSCIICHIPMH